jgi:hypothetical protein
MFHGVENIEVDLFKFNHIQFLFIEVDLRAYIEYIDEDVCHIHVIRLDTNIGWDNDVTILVVDKKTEIAHIVNIGSSDNSEKVVPLCLDRVLTKSFNKYHKSETYYDYHFHKSDSIIISRESFNKKFKTNVVELPSHLFAVGFKDGFLYTYSESYQHYANIVHVINHIITVAKTSEAYSGIHFLISSCDGYIEEQYQNDGRHKPCIVGEFECRGKYLYNEEHEDEYPVYYQNRIILAQSIHKNTPYVSNVVDRHFFFHNKYSGFRSFHCGIPFHVKESKIVYAGQLRGNKYNFMQSRYINMNQRLFFESDAVPKTNIVCGRWIDREDMIHYKYILDIDGNSSTWDATAWKLNSGSVIFKCRSGWRQWFYDDYVSGEHFVEINDDFSDIDEKFAWCQENPKECVRIVENCKRLFQKVYNMKNIIAHTEKILDKIVEYSI